MSEQKTAYALYIKDATEGTTPMSAVSRSGNSVIGQFPHWSSAYGIAMAKYPEVTWKNNNMVDEYNYWAVKIFKTSDVYIYISTALFQMF